MHLIEKIRQYRFVSLHIASHHFNPGIFSTLLTAALLYTMVSLALWQQQRAEYKDTLQQKIIERKKLSAVDVTELPASRESRRYLPVTFTGEFDNRHSFLLDNITLDRHVGYHVYTPVKIKGFKSILVNRGFVPQGKTRDQLPQINVPEGKIKITGLLDFSPSRTLLLAENVQETARWPVVLQYIELSEISTLLNDDLYDMVLWLNPDESAAFEYDLPVLNLNAAKNNGYAFQWFAMSLTLLVIYIVVNTKKQTAPINKNPD